MRAGEGSRTAVLVCAGRALAHGNPDARAVGFDDPTAFTLLPEDARALLGRIRADEAPLDLRERLERAFVVRNTKLMIARTIAIDEQLREDVAPQVVVLGAGLDGRAWRMPELRDAIVFEIDHPDSQRNKRKHIAGLEQQAAEVRFVPVDFTRDRLDDALAAAGHDPQRRTTWIWEGVVMYLAKAEVEASLAVIAKRSAPSSRLLLVYHRPRLMRWAVGLFVRWLGEPLRSAFTAAQLEQLLAAHGFRVLEDRDATSITIALSPELARDAAMLAHVAIATAVHE